MMKYLEVEGVGRPKAEGQRRRAARRGEEDRSLIRSNRSPISDARCVLKLEFKARCDDRCALLLEVEESSVGCCR